LGGAPDLRFSIQPGGCLRGTLQVPGDKSISHRSIVLGALAEGETRIHGFLEGEDALATLAAFRRMGVGIEGPMTGECSSEASACTACASRTAVGHGQLRDFHAPALRPAVGQRFPVTLIGDTSLMRRPMRRVTQPLDAWAP